MIAQRDAALTRTTSGWWEVELLELTEMRNGDLRMAHVFRDHFEHVEVATAIIQDFLGPVREGLT